MSNIKDQLIRLGSENPELRDDIRPVLNYMTSKKEAASRTDSIKGFVSHFLNQTAQEMDKNLGGSYGVAILEPWSTSDASGLDLLVKKEVGGRSREKEFTLLFSWGQKQIQISGDQRVLNEWGAQYTKGEVVKGAAKAVVDAMA